MSVAVKARSRVFGRVRPVIGMRGPSATQDIVEQHSSIKEKP